MCVCVCVCVEKGGVCNISSVAAICCLGIILSKGILKYYIDYKSTSRQNEPTIVTTSVAC